MDYYIRQIEGCYDGENDLIPGAPAVTGTDYGLLQICLGLREKIENLEDELAQLKNNIKPECCDFPPHTWAE